MNQQYFNNMDEITQQYFKLKDRADKYRNTLLWNAFRIAKTGGWQHDPKNGFLHYFHNWVVCSKFRNPQYNNQIMYTVYKMLQNEWKAHRIIERWYDRKMKELRDQFISQNSDF